MSDYVRYLTAKRTVDDRAINRTVAETVAAELRSNGDRPVSVLDVGAGTGSMLVRMAEWGLVAAADYTALDRDAAALAAARQAWRQWCRQRGWACQGAGDALVIRGGGLDITARTVCADLFEPAAGAARFDLLIANAVLDLVNVPAALPALWQRLEPGALFWFTINFDGETIFHPEHALDMQVISLYHRTMDERVTAGRRAGDSRTGRHLFAHVPASGAEILAAGSSDWVVHPRSGSYPAREGEFLRHIIDTVDGALRDRPELDGASLAAWVAERRRQIDACELALIAHQLDVAGRAPR